MRREVFHSIWKLPIIFLPVSGPAGAIEGVETPRTRVTHQAGMQPRNGKGFPVFDVLVMLDIISDFRIFRGNGSGKFH